MKYEKGFDVKFFQKKPKNEKAKNNSSSKTKKPTSEKTAPVFLATCIAAGLIPLLFTALFLNNHYIENNNHQRSKAVSTYYSGLQAQAFKTILNKYNLQLSSIAQTPKVIAALMTDTGAQLKQLKEIAKDLRPAFPASVRLRLLKKGKLTNIETTGDIPISYSGLDLIRRAEQENQAINEAIKIKDAWHIMIVNPIHQSNDKETVIGTVYLIINPAQISHEFTSNTNNQGNTALLQTFKENKPQTIITAGDGNEGAFAITTKIDNTPWSVLFTPSITLLNKQKISNSTLMYSFLGCSIFFIISVLLAYLKFSLTLTKNIQEFGLYLEGVLAGKSPLKEPILSFPQLQHILENIMTLKPRKTPEVNDSDGEIHQEASATQEANAVNSSHQENDIFDIDTQDEDEDFLNLSEEDNAPNNSATANKKTLAVSGINAQIFRAYDIRGVAGTEIKDDDVINIGRAIGSEVLDQQQSSIIVAADGRLTSPNYVLLLTQGILSTGCNVINIGMVPSPVLYFATHTLSTNSGVVVTASHNPPEYNGFKIVINGKSLFDEAILSLKERINNRQFHSGTGTVSKTDVIADYIERITSDIALADSIKVVIDCGNGVAGNIAPQLFEELGCEVIPLHCDVDGNFPNHHPDPSDIKNLEDLIAKVLETGADLGIALDGDGDRIGVVTAKGNVILPDRLLMLFAKDIVSRNPGTDVLFDVKCTRHLNSVISSYGGRPVMWKTGHSFMKEKMIETGALLGGEFSGHIFFKERWFGFDDGIYSAARLMEILTVRDQDIDSVFDAFPTGVSTPEIRIDMVDEIKFTFIQDLQNKGDFSSGSITTIDGIRVDFSDGWGLVRASNTTPAITLRYEAENEEALERIKKIFKSQMLLVDSTLVIHQ